MRESRTLKQSLVISHFLVSLIPLGFIGVFLLLFYIHSIREDSMVKIGMLAQGSRGQIQLFMEQPLTVLRNIRQMLLHSTDPVFIRQVLDSHVLNSPFFEAVYLLDGKGKVINAGMPAERMHYRDDLIGIQLGHKSEFLSVIQTGQPQWSDTFLSLSSGKISLTLFTSAHPYVLAADINLNALAQLISRLSRNNVVTMVIDRNGAIIFHPDPELMSRSIMVNDIDLVSEALQGKERTGEFNFLGNRYIGSASIIEPAGWVSLIAEPMELQHRRLVVPFLIIMAGLAGAAALSLVLALYRSRAFSQPLIEITAKSAVMAQGNYQTSLPQSHIRELGQLAGSIQHMARSIQKRETQLLANERKYRELVENTSNLVLRLDRDFSIVYANHTIKRLTGHEAASAEGEPLSLFIADEDFAKLRELVEGCAIEGKNNENLETRIRHVDGSESNLLMTLHLHYDANGQVEELNIIGHDITVRYQLERQQREIEQQQQQSHKMELLGLMASGVAHDLNNILAGIINYPELLLLKMANDDPQRPVIAAIKKSGERAAAVVADLLTISRNSASVHQVTDINALIGSYCSSPDFRKLQEHHPEVDFAFLAEEELWLCSCSPSHIEKTLANLVINGFEAIKKIGKVTVRTENVTPEEITERALDLPPECYIAIHVCDNGEGIASEEVAHIFEPFFSKKGLGRSGTGLGLTVAWSCVREHNGTIEVTSSTTGTEFTVYLPATSAEPLSQPKVPTLAELAGAGQSILVVDDEEALREIAENMLKTLNYRVASVASGEEAIEWLQQHQADLILLDMQMAPGISGKETYERISFIDPKQQALVVSGFSNSRDVDAVLANGASGFIKKPYSIMQLGMAVQAVLNRA